MSSETTGATGLAGRYATAAFELAESEQQFDEVARDLQELSEMIAESADLKRMIRSPVISRADQARAMEALLERVGASALTRKLIGVIAMNRRLFALPDIIDEYLMILAGRRGEMTAEVTSAAPLTDAQREALTRALAEATGGKITVRASVDPEVLGGLVVKLGSRMIDSSLNTKLQHLRLAMRGIG